MGTKLNWGAGLRSLGQGIGAYAQRQYQEDLRQQELARREQWRQDGWDREDALAGQAEAEALANATESVVGATAYVTLEPCSYHGRTPSCADALIKAGVGVVEEKQHQL